MNEAPHFYNRSSRPILPRPLGAKAQVVIDAFNNWASNNNLNPYIRNFFLQGFVAENLNELVLHLKADVAFIYVVSAGEKQERMKLSESDGKSVVNMLCTSLEKDSGRVRRELIEGFLDDSNQPFLPPAYRKKWRLIIAPLSGGIYVRLTPLPDKLPEFCEQIEVSADALEQAFRDFNRSSGGLFVFAGEADVDKNLLLQSLIEPRLQSLKPQTAFLSEMSPIFRLRHDVLLLDESALTETVYLTLSKIGVGTLIYNAELGNGELELLVRLCRRGVNVIVVCHAPDALKTLERLWQLADGFRTDLGVSLSAILALEVIGGEKTIESKKLRAELLLFSEPAKNFLLKTKNPFKTYQQMKSRDNAQIAIETPDEDAETITELDQ